MDQKITKVRKNVYLRPWIVNYLDKERVPEGLSFSSWVDSLLEDHIREVVSERKRESVVARSRSSLGEFLDEGDGDGSLPMPKE